MFKIKYEGGDARMRFLKVLTVSLMAALILGCEDERNASIEKSGSIETETVNNRVVSTGIYLPGGTGLDFGRYPISDKTRKKKDQGKYRVVIYEIDERYEDVDSALSEIMLGDGYRRRVSEDEEYDLKVTFSKDNSNPILVRYKSVVKDGLKKKTQIVFWWLLD
ncbi:hypothetical protein [Phytopseudomonas daroniae]|uniref:hypothetical protein n=1 Tax=Phytopseudomonas daroniae TaxID=2487519 RepID=UPI0010385712|nr:hypothetical protein [Pseudomonas daroniae]